MRGCECGVVFGRKAWDGMRWVEILREARGVRGIGEGMVWGRLEWVEGYSSIWLM